jgi:hypothetical protein
MKSILILCAVIGMSNNISLTQSDCLFKNPLCFYNTDILTYLQVLHKNQKYENIMPFLYGPFVDSLGKKKLICQIKDVDFGYSMKRAGVKEIAHQKWSLTYQRTIMGTNESFKIDCSIVNDTCRVFIDLKVWNKIFK